MSNLGDSNTPVEGASFGLPAGAELGEDNGDLVIQDSSGSIILRRDETNAEWQFENTDLTGINAINATSVTTEAIATTAETPSDVSGSRSLNTEYQNSGTCDLKVWVEMASDGSQTIEVTLQTGTTSGSLKGAFPVIDASDISSTTRLALGPIRVPPGNYYRVAEGGSNAATIQDWFEWRTQ